MCKLHILYFLLFTFFYIMKSEKGKVHAKRSFGALAEIRKVKGDEDSMGWEDITLWDWRT